MTMSRFSRTAAVLVAALGLTTITAPARAQGADQITRLRETLKREPKAPEVVQMALDYYRASPEEMASLRSSARWRGLMPVISGFVGYNSQGTSSAQAQTISNPQNVVINAAQAATVFTGGIAFDLRDLVFNPAEIQTYAVLPMQRDITLEVVRTYYLRRQLQIRLALKPPADPLAVAMLELRIEEYTGILNAMTGGSFSRVAAASDKQQ
jgi:hypothetical protein